MNGKHFPVRDLAKNMGEFAPPIHPNCRCTTAPWVDEDAYNDWLNAKADGSFSGGFDEWKNGIINAEIDELTPCLRNLKTGEIVQTTVKEITPQKGQFKDWEFDWTLPQKNGFRVFALYADGDERIQGLVATKPVKENIAIKIDIVEAAPFNNKHNPINTAHKKEYSGVGGHLFAEAVKQSYENGFDGFVYFQAKTNLINHYIKTLGAEEIANNRTMSISGKEARVLYEEYYGKK